MRQQGDITVIRPQDPRIDASIAPEFKRRGLELISMGKGKVIVDLSQVKFIDSSGLGALVSFVKAVGRNGNIALVGLTPGVKEILRLTRLDRVFQIFSSEKEALGHLSPRARGP